MVRSPGQPVDTLKLFIDTLHLKVNWHTANILGISHQHEWDTANEGLRALMPFVMWNIGIFHTQIMF